MKLHAPTTFTVLAIIGLLAALALLLPGRGEKTASWSGKTLRVGWAEEYPFAFRDAAGQVTGEAPETARAALARLGITDVRWVLLDFARLVPALEEGDIDMIAAGMFITPERAARIDFSLPTVRVSPGLLVRSGNPRGLFSYDELARRLDVTVAVLKGSVEQRYFTDLGVLPGRLFVAPDAATGAAAVAAGRADALALSDPTVRLLARESGGVFEAASLAAGQAEDGRERQGLPAFGFRKADAALRAAMDEVLRDFVGAPEHLELIAPFGFDSKDMPDYVRK
jgi:polar amino acid transport system substrate-binding protein